jgi:hypothetical protein
MSKDPDVDTLHDQAAPLEQSFIEDFIRRHGQDPATLKDLPAAEREQLLKQASAHAAQRLAEVASRAQYVHHIHGHR